MNKEMKLSEISNYYSISRRAIQGYEAVGLIVPTRKGYRGHLYYDDKTVQRIVLIRFLQNIGFSLYEITEIFDGSTEILSTAIETKIKEMKLRVEEVEQNAVKAKEIIKILNSKGKDTLAIHRILTEEGE